MKDDLSSLIDKADKKKTQLINELQNLANQEANIRECKIKE